MRLDKMRKAYHPARAGDGALGLWCAAGFDQGRTAFSIGYLDDQHAEFGGRPDPLGAVEIRAGISASNAQPSGVGWGGAPGYAIGVVGENDLLRQSRKR